MAGIKRHKFSILLVLAIVFSVWAEQSFTPAIFDGLTVTFVDVGQGDSILLQTPGAENVLIDCGEAELFDKELMPFLRSRGVKKLDTVVATHYHSDHLGGMEQLFGNFYAETLVVPDYEPDNNRKKTLLKAAEKHKIRVEEVSEGNTIPENDDDLSIFVLHPQKYGFSDNENDNSLVLKVEYNGRIILLTGDLEEEGEDRLLKKYDIESDVLKVGHHGSSTSSSRAFLAEVDPTYAVIQCGKNNSYGHPHYETLDCLEDNDVRVYRTDKDGNVTFKIFKDGKIEIETDRF
jgi:DNA internalization-related competence protein ComEC/Rec2